MASGFVIAALSMGLAVALGLLVRARGALSQAESERDALRARLAEAAGEAERERARLALAAREAQQEAERSARARDDLVAMVSHELRTPLNAVLGWARLLRSGKIDPAAAAHAVEGIERSASAQAQIVDDLLDMARIARGELRLDVRAVALVQVVEAAIAAVRPAAAARNIGIAAVLMPAAAPVTGDPGRLQQVVWNLLSNAVKFTPPGGRVEVRLDEEADDAIIRVNDNGEGIDPRFAPHLFEQFRQADSSSTRPHGGLGLGLALVRWLVEAHGGTVCATSGGKGKGATFTVRLPLPARRPKAMGGPRLPTAAAPERPP